MPSTDINEIVQKRLLQKSTSGREKLENLTLRCDNLKRLLRIYIIIRDYVIVSKHKLLDTRLYEHESYEHYKKVQQFHNERKIDSVWADEETLKK